MSQQPSNAWNGGYVASPQSANQPLNQTNAVWWSEGDGQSQPTIASNPYAAQYAVSMPSDGYTQPVNPVSVPGTVQAQTQVVSMQTPLQYVSGTGPQPSPAPSYPNPYPQPVPASPSPAPAAAKHPANPRRRILIAVIAALVVALFIGGMVLNNIAETKGDPRGPIKQYLSLLEAGNYGQAAALADSDLSDDEKVLLQDGIIEEQANRISNPKIDNIDQSTDGAYTASVSYTVGGESQNGTVIVKREGNFLNPTWTFKQSLLGAVLVPVMRNSTAIVAGKKLTDENVYSKARAVSSSGSNQEWQPFAAYPGVYALDAQPYGRYSYVAYRELNPTATVRAGDFTSTNASQTFTYVTDQLENDLDSMLKKHLDACVSNANAGGPIDRTCYINAGYAERRLADTINQYQQTNVTVNTYPTAGVLGYTNFSILDDGSISGTITDGSSVTVEYNYGMGGLDKNSSMSVYSGGDYFSQEKKYTFTVGSDDTTIDIEYGDVYSY